MWPPVMVNLTLFYTNLHKKARKWKGIVEPP